MTAPTGIRVSKSCEHALRAVLKLVALGGDGYVPIYRLGRELGISSPTLTKILQHLTSSSLLKSKRGPLGGVALARDPDKVSIYDVVVAIDGPGVFDDCILGLGSNGRAGHCPLEAHWAGSCGQLARILQDTTLADTLGASSSAEAD